MAVARTYSGSGRVTDNGDGTTTTLRLADGHYVEEHRNADEDKLISTKTHINYPAEHGKTHSKVVTQFADEEHAHEHETWGESGKESKTVHTYGGMLQKTVKTNFKKQETRVRYAGEPKKKWGHFWNKGKKTSNQAHDNYDIVQRPPPRLKEDGPEGTDEAGSEAEEGQPKAGVQGGHE